MPTVMPRPHLANGLPAWLSAPDIALPVICLQPKTYNGDPDTLWSVSIALGSMDESRYITIEVDFQRLVLLLSDWRLSPEQCCRRWFRSEAPTASKPREPAHALSSENIGI